MPDRLHLNLSMMTPGQLRHAWRLPHADPLAYLDIDHFTRLARVADAAGVDAVLLGDAPVLGPDIVHAPATGLDPVILLATVAARTERLGIIATVSTTYNAPFNVARRFQTLDHVTKGRVGVNLVTTAAVGAAANFGVEQHPDRETRYRSAREFAEVVTRLWDSWEPGWLVADKSTGEYADRSRIHPIDHEGEFFSVAGPLPVAPGPQGWPVVVQAGGSDGGVRLAGDVADVVFAVAQTQDRAVAFRDDVRRHAAEAGRHPDAVKISLGVVVIVGLTEEDAQERALALYATLPVEEMTPGLLANLGLAPDSFGPDDPIGIADLPDAIPSTSFSTGFSTSTRALLAVEPLTPRELIRRGAGGSGHRLVVGSPTQVADDLQDWFEAGAADGFTVMPADTSVDLERFATLVVPILQGRGLHRPPAVDSTLRERLGLSERSVRSRAAG